MHSLIEMLNFNPLPSLLHSKNPAISFFIERDILEKTESSNTVIDTFPHVQKLLKNQQPDGSWLYPGVQRELYPPHHYPLLETWKQLSSLIQQYKLTNENPVVRNASEYLLSCQTDLGDIRGLIGNQYATYYTGAMLGLLISAGYENDSRIIKGLEWLLSMRQDDGGWSVPLVTHSYDRKTQYRLTSTNVPPVDPDRSKPFSHNWTDMVLRGFSAHPVYRYKPEIIHAALLLKSRFFQNDAYASYKESRYWTRFSFWWPNVLTALESLYNCGFTADDPDIRKGLQWFIDNQQDNGLWELVYPPPKKIHNMLVYRERQEWLALRILCLFEKYYR
ncbi:MAG: hypothetical protein KKC68_05150 [Candidatus Thermoplasmatota archaeon]|nr:hypothetical protein [Candidatus Thermoplasmatota archaeon]